MGYFDAFKVLEKEVKLSDDLAEKKLIKPFESSSIFVDEKRILAIERATNAKYKVRKNDGFFQRNGGFSSKKSNNKTDLRLTLVKIQNGYTLQYNSKIIGLKFSVIAILAVLIGFILLTYHSEVKNVLAVSVFSGILFLFCISTIIILPLIENRRRAKLIIQFEDYLYDND
jgi:hypothetical protein